MRGFARAWGMSGSRYPKIGAAVRRCGGAAGTWIGRWMRLRQSHLKAGPPSVICLLSQWSQASGPNEAEAGVQEKNRGQDTTERAAGGGRNGVIVTGGRQGGDSATSIAPDVGQT